MKRATILFTAVLAAGLAGVTMPSPLAQAKHSSQNQDQSSLIKKGMTLDDVHQVTGANPTTVGAPRDGVQTYRVSVRLNSGDGGVNDHPTFNIYMFGLKDGKVSWVRKTQ
jgi:hypothetical protein